MSDTTITLSLISHTNVGKTTLARTLLRREIGEVRDQAHVTEVSEAHTLMEHDGASLQLWDTPGFGDSARLMKRLRAEKQPIGWLLHQVWDRLADRPLYCSQRAIHNIREDADVVLYLVNASEEPEDAGYVALELELLTWMKRPVLLLLNQVGAGGELLVERWRSYTAQFSIVQDVLSLDAFTRCWVEEIVLFDRVCKLLPSDRQATMRGLSDLWTQQNRAIFQRSCQQLGAYLSRCARDSELAAPVTRNEGTLAKLRDSVRWNALDKKGAMRALNERLDHATQELAQGLIAEHGLTGTAQTPIEKSLQDFQVSGGLPLDETGGAVMGAVVSGALGGLAADILSGGLSLGGGMIAGGILGALGGSALAKGYRLMGGEQQPGVRWSELFLHQLTGQSLLRYLAVAHFGRGQGEYAERDHPEHWKRAVTQAVQAERGALDRLWKRAGSHDLAVEYTALVERMLLGILRASYPEAMRLTDRVAH